MRGSIRTRVELAAGHRLRRNRYSPKNRFQFQGIRLPRTTPTTFRRTKAAYPREKMGSEWLSDTIGRVVVLA